MPEPKPATLVAEDAAIRVREPEHAYVGRGGVKLAGALDGFGVVVAGRRALDAGASTGGFTDCLLQAGAASVVAVDVGTNQLRESLRSDRRVESLEQTDIRSLDDGFIADRGTFDVVVVDLSFISTTGLLPRLGRLLAPDGDLIVLVKPQFEAGRVEASRGSGVIRDPEVWRRVLHDFIDAAAATGVPVDDLAISPLTGTRGNVEFLAHLRRPDILGG